MRFKFHVIFLISLCSAAQASDNCAQDGKILARVAFVISEHNLGDLLFGADAYEDAVKKDVEIFSKTTDAVFVATADYVPPGFVKDGTTKKNGTPVTHMQLEFGKEGSFLERLPKFDKQMKEIIDDNPKFKELYSFPGERASKEELDSYYTRARSGIQLFVVGSDHGGPDLQHVGSYNMNGVNRAKLTNLSGEIRPSTVGSLGKASFDAMAKSFRGMATMQLYGQCQGNDVGRELVDAQITENKKIDQSLECACFASQGQAFMAANSPRVGQQFESEPFKSLDREKQKYTLLQAAARGIKFTDLTFGVDRDGSVLDQAKDSGMTGSETTLLVDVQREFKTDHPVFADFKNPADLSPIMAKQKDGTSLFSEAEQRSLLQSELERIKGVYSNFGKDVAIDTDLKDVGKLYEYTSEKRSEVLQMLSNYKQMREQQKQSLAKIEAKRNTLISKVKSLGKFIDDTYQKSTDKSLNKTFGAIVGTAEDLASLAKAIDVQGLKKSIDAAKNWELFLEAKKLVAGFRLKIDAVSGFLHNGYKELNQNEIKKFGAQIQGVVDASDAFLADLIEPIKPVLVAETILSRTLVEANTMKDMSNKEDPTLAKKKEEFFRQRRCELMDIRPNGTQMYGSTGKAPNGKKEAKHVK